MNFLCVALGGALGALGRYAVSMLPVKTEFPFLTLITNILGAVLIGFIAGMAGTKENISPNTVLFWKTGVCGGFTTFSTFALETFDLIQAGNTAQAILYVVLSLVLGIGAVFVSQILVK